MQGAFDAVGDVIEHAAQPRDVVPVERGDECGDQLVHHAVTDLVRRLFDAMHLVESFQQTVRFVMVHDFRQQMCRLACIIGALLESVEIERIVFPRHMLILS